MSSVICYSCKQLSVSYPVGVILPVAATVISTSLKMNCRSLLNKCNKQLIIGQSRTFVTGTAVCTPKKQKKLPGYEDHLPVYDFGKVNLENKRLYVFGSAVPIGLPFLIKPKKEGQSQHLYMPRPVRNEFGYYHPVFDVAAGSGFTLLATKLNKNNNFYLFGCGMNSHSQLGYQSARANAPMELLLSFTPIALPASPQPKILCLGAGRAHSLVSVQDEGLFSFGDNSNGRCGRFVISDEEYGGSRLVHKVKMEIQEDIVSISTKFDLSICITRSGQVITFGSNNKGQLGRGKMIPGNWIAEQVKGDLFGEKVVNASTSGASVLCVTEKGELFGWGCNEWGQIDSRNASNVYYEPRFIKLHRSIGKVKSVAMGDVYSFILNDKGNVYVWGHGYSLGLGPEAQYVPKPTLMPPPLFGRNEFNLDTQVIQVVASTGYAAAVNSVGDLYTWGVNKSGCLGLQGLTMQPFPLKVCMGGFVHKVALGDDHTVVLCKGGF